MHALSISAEAAFDRIDDPVLRAELARDPELCELAQLSAFADRVRATLAPERIELHDSERVRRIEEYVLHRIGILPSATADMDDASKDRALDRGALEYRSGRVKRGPQAVVASARTRRDGP